jgi:hypothetical protein
VRPRVGPAFLERRLQSVGWSPRLLHFFQLLLAELGAARCDDLKFDTNSKCPLCIPPQSQKHCLRYT